jgi:hypothetical protein
MRLIIFPLLLAFAAQGCGPGGGASAEAQRTVRAPPPDFRATYSGKLAKFAITNDGPAPSPREWCRSVKFSHRGRLRQTAGCR